MFIRLIAAFVAMLVCTVSASLAKDGSPPTIDLRKTCQATVAAAAAIIGNIGQGDIDVCMQDEEAARMQLLNEWANFPALAKSRCVKPQEYVPSYVEWVACLEMTRDVLKMRQQEQSSAPAAGLGKNSRECPVVEVDQDGAIKSVIACRLATER